jgi:hypothetical protein
VTLAWESDEAVLVKVRLAPGTQVTVWVDEACGTPSANGRLIPASGAFAIPLRSIGGPGKGNVCVSSNDGGLRTFLPVLPKISFVMGPLF